MPGKPQTIAIVIPTIGRYAELRRMLTSLTAQSQIPEQVIIIDETEPQEDLAGEFCHLNLQVLSLPGGSTSAKRNMGARAVWPNIALVAFLDDDIVLDRDAIEAMLAYWEHAPEDIGGAGFNFINCPTLYASRLKSLHLTALLGLYDTQKGAVLRSGIHTVAGYVSETTYVRWLPAGASVYTRKVLERNSFDEWFQGYGYLEDLDLSYRIGKEYRLAVVATARFYHYPSDIGRLAPYSFGKREVVNRLYFVRKHEELSQSLCCVAIMLRALMSLWLGLSKRESSYFKRVAGNLAGLLSSLRTGLKPAKNRCPGAGNSDMKTTSGSETIGSYRHENF